ncbi:MAG: hypothetical protein JNL74_23775 [Fibrobacteres bacterium]|nr:hypothetical protein [Fibrobacterota bacterium]
MIKHIITFTLMILFISCSDFPSRFNRLDGNKIRPLTIICEPPEASPGDTINVRLIGEFPTGIPEIEWTVAFDFGEDQAADDVYEKQIVQIKNLGFKPTSGTGDISFSFVIPDTALLLSASFRNNPAVLASGLSPDSLNKLLLNIPNASFLPTEIADILSLIGARIKLRAHMEQDISLDVTKPISIRFLRKFGITHSNKNPNQPSTMKIITVKTKGVINSDSIQNYDCDSITLSSTGSGLFPQTKEFVGIPDTLNIDRQYQYFLRIDTTIGTQQTYRYLSLNGSWKDDGEEIISCSWFSQNLDELPDMERDSLVLVLERRGLNDLVREFLPSVDNRLQKARFHAVLRDRRDVDPLDSPGTSYMWGEVYFKY